MPIEPRPRKTRAATVDFPDRYGSERLLEIAGPQKTRITFATFTSTPVPCDAEDRMSREARSLGLDVTRRAAATPEWLPAYVDHLASQGPVPEFLEPPAWRITATGLDHCGHGYVPVAELLARVPVESGAGKESALGRIKCRDKILLVLDNARKYLGDGSLEFHWDREGEAQLRVDRGYSVTDLVGDRGKLTYKATNCPNIPLDEFEADYVRSGRSVVFTLSEISLPEDSSARAFVGEDESGSFLLFAAIASGLQTIWELFRFEVDLVLPPRLSTVSRLVQVSRDQKSQPVQGLEIEFRSPLKIRANWTFFQIKIDTRVKRVTLCPLFVKTELESSLCPLVVTDVVDAPRNTPTKR